MSNHTLMLYASLEASEPTSGPAAFAVGAAAALGAHLDVLAPYTDILVPANWEGRTAEQTLEAFRFSGSPCDAKPFQLCFQGHHDRRSALTGFCLRTADQRGDIDDHVAKSTGHMREISIEDQCMDIGIKMLRDGSYMESNLI